MILYGRWLNQGNQPLGTVLIQEICFHPQICVLSKKNWRGFLQPTATFDVRSPKAKGEKKPWKIEGWTFFVTTFRKSIPKEKVVLFELQGAQSVHYQNKTMDNVLVMVMLHNFSWGHCCPIYPSACQVADSIHELWFIVQGWTIRPFPGCENAVGKFKQKW